MKKVANISAYIFITAVALLAIVSVLGVWDFFDGDVIMKSFQSVGLLALVSVIIILAEHFVDKKEVQSSIQSTPAGVPVQVISQDESLVIFSSIRIITVSMLIASIALLALAGILSIWEVLLDPVFGKSLASIAIIAFSSLIIIATCLEREDNPILRKKNFSGIAILIFIIAIWVLFASVSSVSY